MYLKSFVRYDCYLFGMCFSWVDGGLDEFWVGFGGFYEILRESLCRLVSCWGMVN